MTIELDQPTGSTREPTAVRDTRSGILAAHLWMLRSVYSFARQTRGEEEIALYLVDLIDPLGFAFAHMMRARFEHPDPRSIIRARLPPAPSIRPIITVQFIQPDKLAAAVESLPLPRLATIAAQLRGAPRPQHISILTVAAHGMRLDRLHLMGLQRPLGRA